MRTDRHDEANNRFSPICERVQKQRQGHSCTQATFSSQLVIAGHVFLWANAVARASTSILSMLFVQHFAVALIQGHYLSD